MAAAARGRFGARGRSASGKDAAGEGASDAPDDEAALVALAKQDRQAFGLLYDRYVGPVYGYCHARLGDRDAAEDATSQTFAKALAALPTCRDDRFRAWLFGIAHNVSTDAFRRAKPTRPLDDAGAIPAAGEGPDSLAVAAEERRALLAAITRLPNDQRRVLELRLAGLSGAEIAAALGRSPAATKQLQHRAVTRLRAELGDAGDRDDR